MDYSDFLKSKIALAQPSGIKTASAASLSPLLKPHQRDLALWAIRGGRRAVFAAFGLGKTFIQLEICRVISQAENCRALIILPLGVRQEFFRDAALKGGYCE